MKVGGRDFNFTKEQVEARMKGMDPDLIQKHVVEVNGQLYPPKQVLGQVTGWERTSFTTMEAQRILTRIGFVCTRVPGGSVQQAGEWVLGVVRDSAQQTMRDHGDVQFQRGFTRGADITLSRIQEKLDVLREQMKGAGLGKVEQAIYAHLDELKSEIEADCDRYWRGSGVDWRPSKPVAKALNHRAQSPEVEV